MQVLTFVPRDYFGSNTYVLISDSEAAVIDPSVEYDKIKSELGDKVKVKYIILTHAHFDHMLKIDSWVNNTDAEVIVGRGDRLGLTDGNLNCYRTFFGDDKGYYGAYTTVSEGDTLQIGSTVLSVIETPGHTQGSISLFSGDCLFVGDLLFAGGGIGRTDLPGGDYVKLAMSIRKILKLPVGTMIYSGHGKAHELK